MRERERGGSGEGEKERQRLNKIGLEKEIRGRRLDKQT